MSILGRALMYFLVVFAAGFVLALVRIPFVEPMLGQRLAELLEMPLMLAVIWWAAGRVSVALSATGPALACGVLALGLLLLVEFGVVLFIRGMTVETYFDSRDPVAGAVYAISLLLFALMPALRQWTGKPGVSR